MQRSDILALMNLALTNKGRPAITSETVSTREANFRSLDFSETALRIEAKLDRELTFDAAAMRQVETVKDVLDFFEKATA